MYLLLPRISFSYMSLVFHSLMADRYIYRRNNLLLKQSPRIPNYITHCPRHVFYITSCVCTELLLLRFYRTAREVEGVHKRKLLMSSPLLLPQYSAYQILWSFLRFCSVLVYHRYANAYISLS